MAKRVINTITLSSIAKTNIFAIPEGYFASLPAAIEKKLITNQNNWLRTMVFTVPDNYFEKLPIKIQQRLKQEGLPEGLQNHPFRIPENYFNQLPGKILEEKLGKKNLSEKVSPGYSVPADYFDTLAGNIQERIQDKKQQPETPVYALPIFRYAAAASVLLSVIISLALFYQNNLPEQQTEATKQETTAPTLAETMIENLSKEEIKTYLEHQEHLDVAQLIEHTSPSKKSKIEKDFENDFLKIRLEEKEKKELETELEDLDLTGKDAEI